MGATSLFRNSVPLVTEVSLLLSSLPLRADATVILLNVAQLRLRGRRVCMGHRTMTGWLRRTRYTVIRALAVLETKDYIIRVRRGKKLTNLYFLSKRIWAWLSQGRKVPRLVRGNHDKGQICEEDQAALLQQLKRFGLKSNRFLA